MEIRERRAEDFDDLVPLIERVHLLDNYPIFLRDGDVARFLSNPTPMDTWVAIHADRILGHVALNETTSRPAMELAGTHAGTSRPAYVARLVLDPDSRGQGIGRRLLDHAHRAAIERKCSPFLDVVDRPGSAPAIALYQHAGWQEIGRVPFDLAGDKLQELVFCGPTT